MAGASVLTLPDILAADCEFVNLFFLISDLRQNRLPRRVSSVTVKRSFRAFVSPLDSGDKMERAHSEPRSALRAVQDRGEARTPGRASDLPGRPQAPHDASDSRRVAFAPISTCPETAAPMATIEQFPQRQAEQRPYRTPRTTSRPSRRCSARSSSTTTPSTASPTSSKRAFLRGDAPPHLRDRRIADPRRQDRDAGHAQDLPRRRTTSAASPCRNIWPASPPKRPPSSTPSTTAAPSTTSRCAAS